MLTQCPNCQTVYQILASELGVAKGFVQCGECEAQFNALDRIADEPSFDHSSQTAAYRSDREVTDSTILPTRSPDQADELDDTQEIDIIEQTEKTGDDAIADHTTLPAEDHAILFKAPEEHEPELAPESQANETAQVNFASADIDLEDVPSVLQDEFIAMTERPKRRVSVVWMFFAFILSAVLAVQFAWNFRQPFLAVVPQAKPLMSEICSRIGCEVTESMTIEPIQLVSRDVRTHPRYENALLVNASLQNFGKATIAFPTLQLGLFNQTGNPIGVRRFAPQEYLDKSIDLDAGLPAGRSVHLVLELANMEDAATSFEFSFP